MRSRLQVLTLVAAIGGFGLLAVPTANAAETAPPKARVECEMDWKGGTTVTYWADASQGCFAGGKPIAWSGPDQR
ncbi:hypothetical protein ACIGW8_34400 [Streptomyces sioyaensis]|uniref:hypothetical protein n=1 Tax=Streptomyces sioyaensis TaxID=67364 RepID=UPI0037D23745